ncbi:methyltransferase [Nesterenkonia sp. AN1]|uniref:Chemotaxis protein methyltransferase CheR n=1 Tax=Nesterenkonia aurantiaca TaxID=1436010 RepID=A0A4R7FW57_9MICC|nr:MULTISPECIES: class I SAM-dependent methyltransferase [Nesterenkonia]EXF24711.1 methyltransferase [Nesterenkonia sp. AN1]TDS82948.1 chemotaxis protein methyltransferase CheR [Nesterenkonia aurantiaca]
MSDDSPKDFWESRYADSERIWSGRVNSTMSSLVADLPAGRALDLGCGEGADVLWLAARGWQAMGIDISATAVARGQAQAETRDLGAGGATFRSADLPEGMPEGPFDLISASFLQSPVALDRQRILQAAADRVAVGGHLTLVSHATAPPWSTHRHGPDEMPTLKGDLSALVPRDAWQIQVGELRERSARGPHGEDATLKDLVILAKRLHR